MKKLTAYIGIRCLVLTAAFSGATAQALEVPRGLDSEQQRLLGLLWIVYAGILSFFKYMYGEFDKKSGEYVPGCLEYPLGVGLLVGGGVGALLISHVFSSFVLQIFAPIAYLVGTYLIVNRFVPYRYRQK
ncbi:hypothetical protein F8S09_11865 [Deinococcus sp. SDU3-2]|uniref:Uncharacterized protein n=1 Tax=Deinococcus terrestris TaxID=2651870 RepID=A0A7X1TSE4_9DEIO|nr:hypothetical protein [Deinococcus terrestris]MPY67374.1 hypothetical protein [Deinococcus terrestris]